MSRRKILVADLLCGAGGSSTGCEHALRDLGLEMELVCVNHWGVAIETHKLNHPEARHYVQDIATVRPHLLVPEGYLDLLMASPTCTHHSVARGGKPTSDQQRSDPWHIITWLTELRVKRIIIENVWEFTNWGPVDRRTGKPIKSRQGEYFWAWVNALKACGFGQLEWRKLNAADYGDATTRHRFIMMGRSDGKRVHYPVATHAKRPASDTVDLFPTLKPWRPAREIIDWNMKGRSIFNRKTPLAPKTLARIYAGAVKFHWPQPYLVILRNHMAAQGLDMPVPTIAANGQHIGIAQPVIVNMKGRSTASSADDPLPTQTAHAGHLFSAEPLICGNRTNNTAKTADEPVGGITTTTGGGQFLAEAVVVRTNMHGRKSPGARGAEDPLMTITTDGGIAMAEPVITNGRRNNTAKGVSTEPLPTLDTKGGVWLAEPIILSQHNSGAPRSADEPLPTITTGGAGAVDHPGCARPMLIEPFIATVAHSGSDDARCKPLGEPLDTIHAGGGSIAMVEAFVLSQGAGGVPREVGQPLPTIPTGGAHALISPYYGSGSGETCTSDETPLPTVTAKARFGVVVPVTNSNGGPGPRSTDEPLPTTTTAKGGEFGVVMPVTHHDGSDRARDVNAEPLPTVTGANRGELAFITAQHGERPATYECRACGEAFTDPHATGAGTLAPAECPRCGEEQRIARRPGQSPRVHSVDEPTPTVAATGHVDLVEGVQGYDILFRMLEPHELAAAMGFDDYKFAGTKTEQIKQIGNAVSVKKLKACVGALMADAAPKKRESAERDAPREAAA